MKKSIVNVTVNDTIDRYLKARKLKKHEIPIARKLIETEVKAGVIKECLYCKELFTTGGNRKLFCKTKCAASFNKEKYHKSKLVKNPVINKCAHCGKSFEVYREGKVYCTPECRNEMWRKIYHDRYAKAFGVKE